MDYEPRSWVYNPTSVRNTACAKRGSMVGSEQNAILLGHGARRSRLRGGVYLQFLSAMSHDNCLVQTKPLRAYLGSGVEKNNRPGTNKRVERLHVRREVQKRQTEIGE